MAARISDQQLSRAYSLIGSGLTVREACRATEISCATWYRHQHRFTSDEDRDRDQYELMKSFNCELFEQLRTYSPATAEKIIHSLQRDVAERFRQTFFKPESIHPRTALRRLENLSSSIDNLRAAYEAVDPQGQQVLNELGAHEFSSSKFFEAIEATLEIPNLLKESAAYTALNDSATKSPIGGRPTDHRIKSLVAALSVIFARTLKQLPTHTIDTVSQLPASRFDRFCEQAFEHFGRGFQKWGALTNAIQDHVPVIDYTAMIESD